MILMEGLMSVPPERSTLIGRALWKTRYVVLGTRAQLKKQPELASHKHKGLKSTPSKPNLVDASHQDARAQDQRLYLSVYKAKGDWEFIHQHLVSAFNTCEIRTLQHRKQGPSLPTLMLELKPDSISEKQRKRRSSRTPGLSSKDPWANALLFRSVQEERYNIYDWQICVKQKMAEEGADETPLAPASPLFSNLNPFSPREPKSAMSPGRPEMVQRSSNQTTISQMQSPKDRPSQLISPSPSLRSRRSDLSSQASSLHPPVGFTSSHTQYSNTIPPDLPSPTSTSGYESQFIEGWTSAQGRSSTLSSHTRGSNSIASAVPPLQVGSTPPGPRETILDRAFQMKVIPGSERGDKEEENISSIARFEALMREVDERKKQKEVVSQPRFHDKSEWDLKEELERSGADSDDDEPKGMEMSDLDIAMPTPAQRALDYISGRRTPLSLASSRPLSPTTHSPPIPFLNSQALSTFHGGPSASGLRLRAGTTSSRNKTSRPSSMALPARSISTTQIPTLKDITSANSNLKASADGKEKRRSSTSVKRLSFQEFTKRLSSTSSLLLVQTNASSSSGRDGSRRTSSEYGFENEERGLRSPAIGPSDREKRCGWRGSIGVFGGEGGFL